MKQLVRVHRRYRLMLPVAIAIAVSLAVPFPALADSGTGTVTVTGTDVAKLTMSIGSAAAAFGTTLTPDGTATGGAITATSAGAAGSEGVYYIWTPASPFITVKSNKTWNGTVYATENSGAGASATLTLASGALRWGTSAPVTYADATALTAFATPTTTTWVSNVSKGINTYQQYYALRIDWSDDPGTFGSTITYTAAQ